MSDNRRTIFRNGALNILMMVYAALFLIIGMVIIGNIVMGQTQWNKMKLLAWADNVINLTRDTVVI